MMKQNKWNLLKEGVAAVGISMILAAAATAIRTLIWMPQIF